MGEVEAGAPRPSSSASRQPFPVAEVKAASPSLDEMEKEHIIKVLRETRGNKKKAAEILGIERRTLYNKAKRLGIDFESI